MPLPLPSLDTRRWSDLVAEGRAIIPRHAPTWTDHNAHDPGIMLMELFAWLSEQLVYRANRVPERHLRKFLALAGFPPMPPQPARVVLGATSPGAGSVQLPAGILLQATGAADGLTTFRVTHAVSLAATAIVAVQGYDGTSFRDLTRPWRDGVPISPLGADPRAPSPYVADRAPALYLGFDRAVPAGDRLHLYVWAGANGAEARERIAAEALERLADCSPPGQCPPCENPSWPCADEADSATAAPGSASLVFATSLDQHHSVRVEWETWGAGGWVPAAVATDETRGLTLDGEVTVEVTAPMASRALGAVSVPCHWLRCRLVAGQFDATPSLATIVTNAVLAEQRLPAWRRFTVVPGATINGMPVAGERQPLELTFDGNGAITAVTVGAASSAAPLTRVLAFAPPAAAMPGTLTLELERLGPGLGFPNQVAELPGAPVAADTLVVRSHEPQGGGTLSRQWTARDDLDAATPTDATVAVDHSAGTLTFGTGVRGRLVPEGAPITASYEKTLGAAGNVSAARTWSLSDDPVNRAIAGPSFAELSALAFGNPHAALGGRDEEDVGTALERAAAFFWSHERLVELADGAGEDSLDQIDAARVTALEAPERATTTLDYERIARDVPGTRVARARAFAGLDTRIPCYDAPGTVTVVVIPHLPRLRPAPSRGLLAAVRRHLERRRIVTTRLRVTGPSYVDVGVVATVRALDTADPARVRDDVVAALDAFLDPLHGGPNDMGWPFGRDVYRSEILATIDAVDGVDHVISATLTVERDGVPDESRCGNVCVPATHLVAPLPHSIEVVTA